MRYRAAFGAMNRESERRLLNLVNLVVNPESPVLNQVSGALVMPDVDVVKMGWLIDTTP
jgi:hypothetical protein